MRLLDTHTLYLRLRILVSLILCVPRANLLRFFERFNMPSSSPVNYQRGEGDVLFVDVIFFQAKLRSLHIKSDITPFLVL